jgi:hypothetical protein
MAAATPTETASCPSDEAYVPNRPVRCRAIALASKVRVKTIARYSASSSPGSRANAGNTPITAPSVSMTRADEMAIRQLRHAGFMG